MRRSYRILILALIAATVGVAGIAPASGDVAFDPNDIVFPVIGEVTYTDTFGAPRGGGRTHKGTDIITADGKGVPVVAAAAGTVSWIGSECCYLAINHGDGWSTWYIHLNNDTPGTDDGAGWGIADGITAGATVEAGELIGWVGDSGNAEATVPHLHFEIRDDGVAINSYPYLLEATVISEPGAATWEGTFRDDDASVHQANIEIIAELGITRGCNPPANDRFCPGRSITRGQMAAFIRRHLNLPATDADYFDDDGASIFEGDINALAEAGIAFGCSETAFCPTEPLRREEMAELLVRTFSPTDPDAYANPSATDYFSDDNGTMFEESINRLRYAGVTVGCNAEEGLYCPFNPVTRAQMATFFARALGLGT